MGWKLNSAVERHEEAPETFKIPPKEEREGLEEGDYAKLLFDFDDDGVERMWVRVDTRAEVNEGGFGIEYVGTLANHPAGTRKIEYGDLVTFTPDHVATVQS